MENSNFKIYLGISIGLVVVFLLIIIIPFSKKTNSSNGQSTTGYLPTPTLVNINSNPLPTAIPANFTGVAEVELPQTLIDASTQKQTLRGLLPITLSSFSIEFNYAEDKFIVTLNDPKDQSRTEFDKWRSNTYPGIDINQFSFQ